MKTNYEKTLTMEHFLTIIHKHLCKARDIIKQALPLYL